MACSKFADLRISRYGNRSQVDQVLLHPAIATQSLFTKKSKSSVLLFGATVYSHNCS